MNINLGHETDKLDVDIRKFLEQAEKVKISFMWKK